jgi:hypothetical protein
MSTRGAVAMIGMSCRFNSRHYSRRSRGTLMSHRVGHCVMTPSAHHMSHAARLGIYMHD